MPETAAEFDLPFHGQKMSPQDVARAIVGPHMSVVNLSLRREPGKEARLGSAGRPSHEHQFFEIAVRRYFRISAAVLSSFDPSLGTDRADAAKTGHAALGTQQRDQGSEHKAFGERASGPESNQIPLSFALPSLSQEPDSPGSGGKPRRIRMGASAGIGVAGSEGGSGGGEGQGGVPVLDDVGRVLLGNVGMQSVFVTSLRPCVCLLACVQLPPIDHSRRLVSRFVGTCGRDSLKYSFLYPFNPRNFAGEGWPWRARERLVGTFGSFLGAS